MGVITPIGRLIQVTYVGPLWWFSEIRPLLWVVLRPISPAYMGYQNSVDHLKDQ
jgi:hypothetical protein